MSQRKLLAGLPAQVRVPSQGRPYIKLHWASSVFLRVLAHYPANCRSTVTPYSYVHQTLVKQALLEMQHEGTQSDLVQQTLKTYLFWGKDPHALYVPLYWLTHMCINKKLYSKCIGMLTLLSSKQNNPHHQNMLLRHLHKSVPAKTTAFAQARRAANLCYNF